MTGGLFGIVGALCGVGTLYAAGNLALSGPAITEETTVSIGLLLVAGGALVAFAWRAGRKSAAIESKIDVQTYKIDLNSQRLNDIHDKLASVTSRLARCKLFVNHDDHTEC